jgi:dethiobiotin synthetase
VTRVVFVTGSDTGVGKTVVTTLLTCQLRQQGCRVAALKPLCSGGRSDALALHAALGGALSLDEINPWHFRAPLAPALAARREHRRVLPAAVLAQVNQAQARFDVVLVEGAGGLLSPLGVGFNARDLIAKLRATPVVVVPNRLGAVNQALLVLAALPRAAARRAQVVLVTQSRPDASARSNAALLAEHLGRDRVHRLPRLRNPAQAASARRIAAGLLRQLFPCPGP